MLSINDVLKEYVERGVLPGKDAEEMMERLKSCGVPHFEDKSGWGFVEAYCPETEPGKPWTESAFGFVYGLTKNREEVFFREEVVPMEGLEEVCIDFKIWKYKEKVVAVEVPFCEHIGRGTTVYFDNAIIGDIDFFRRKGYELFYEPMEG